MIPREIFRLVKRIEIQTTRLVDTVFAGQYQSAFKGEGIEFAEVREYIPGDDIKTIDWNVTARAGFPHVKLFHEERELSVFFAVDVSSSLHFGSQTRLKSEVAAELCSVLAFSAINNNDKIGLILISDQVEKMIPLKKGKQHVLRVVREILTFKEYNKKTKLSTGLDTIGKVLTKRNVLFVISDFMDKSFKRSLSVLNKKHDVIAINLYDPFEYELPDKGLVEFSDLETKKRLFVNMSDKRFRKNFKKIAIENKLERDKYFLSQGIDKIDIDVSKPYIKPLLAFFKKRENRI